MWLHRDDAGVKTDYIIDVMNAMVKKGKIACFGASNWTYDRIAEANDYALKTNQQGFIASQPLYNMATRARIWDDTLVCLEGEEKKKYDQSHFPVFAFSSQAKGFFEKYRKNALSEKAKERYLCDASLETYESIISAAKKSGKSISYTALKMLAEQSDFPVFPIIGPSNVSQLKESMDIH